MEIAMEQTHGNHPTTRSVVAGLHSYRHMARRPNCKPYFKLLRTAPGARAVGGATGPWDVPALCAAYSWPSGLAGDGVIAIVELGGGWIQSDMDQFFSSIGQPAPQIIDVPVDGTQNSPDPNPDGPDGEVALDIQVAAAAYYVATGQPASVRVYWAQDIAPAVRAATGDACDVCSISWGADEAN
jgi:kumamolisin